MIQTIDVPDTPGVKRAVYNDVYRGYEVSNAQCCHIRVDIGCAATDHLLSFDLQRNYYIKNVVLFEENSILLLPERLESSGW